MSEAKTGVTAEKGLTIRSLIIILVFLAILIPYTWYLHLTNPWESWYWMEPWAADPGVLAYLQMLPFYVFVPIFIMSLLGIVSKRLKLTKQEMVVLYTALTFISFMCVWWFSPYQCLVSVANVFAMGEPWSSWLREIVPSVVSPLDPDILGGYMTGGYSGIPSAWTVALVFWILYTICGYSLIIFSLSITRRQHIEVENLDFPLATFATTLIDLTETSTSNRSRIPNIIKNKWWLIGWLICTIWIIPGISYILAHLHIIPDPLMPPPGTLSVGWGGDMIELTTNWVMLSFPIIFPVTLGIALLIPLKILLTYSVWSIIFYWIIPPVLAAAGVFPSWETLMLAGGGFAQTTPGIYMSHFMTGVYYQVGVESAFKWGYTGLMQFGGFAWIAWCIWRGRANYIRSIKAIFRPDPEFEKNEPTSYRNLWIGFILLILVTAAFPAVAGVPYLLSLLLLLIIVFNHCFFESRMAAETGLIGGMNFYTWVGLAWPFMLIIPSLFGYSSTSPVIALVWALILSEWGYWGNLTHTIAQGWQSMYRSAAETKTRSKDVFRISLIVIALITIVQCLGMLSITYIYGANAFVGPQYMGTELWQQGLNVIKTGAIPQGYPLTPAHWGMAGFWAIFMIGICIANTMFPMLPLHPAGVLLGSAPVWTAWFMVPMILATAIKWSVIKFFGAEAYEKKLVPIAVAFIVCMLTWKFIHWTITTTVPY